VTSPAFVTRFAPSPTGQLHLGHAYSAALAFDAARHAGGRFVLRIEDIDLGRSRAESEAGILRDLGWLGLSWEQPVRRQSEHLGDYEAALDRLRADGLVYRCFKTRREVTEDIARAPHSAGEGAYGAVYLGPTTPMNADEENTRLAANEPFAWRLSLKAARAQLGAGWDALMFHEEGAGPDGRTGDLKAQPELLGDAILARKDAPTSYHLAVVCDDALQGVTHVIRGEDLFHVTHLHRLLQVLLDLPTPIYRHHILITDEHGRRFAKRDKAVTLEALREAGVSPGEIRERLGLPPAPSS